MIDFINKYKVLLETKWGLFKKKNHYFFNGEMPFISDKAKLNVFFDSLDEKEINKLEIDFNIIMPNELRFFLKQTNGCRLFFGSFNIFGIQLFPNDLFEAYDFRKENIRFSVESGVESARNDFFFFATFGCDYYFAYKKSEMKKIYCFKRGTFLSVTEYEDFDAFFNHFFWGLMEEYSIDCRKIHINPEDENVPVLAHLTSELF